MYFPSAGIEVEAWLPPLVAFGISFLTSMGGVSGAFLLLPFQVSVLGYTNPSVSATNQLYNIVAIPSGVYRYWREGRMVWPLTWLVVAGTLPGVLVGAFVRVLYLPDPKNFKLFAALVLLYIGARMIRDLLRDRSASDDSKMRSEKRFQELVRNHRMQETEEKEDSKLPTVVVTHCSLRKLAYSFYGENFEVSVLGIFSLSLIVGMVGGIYGIGGGAIIAPFFVTFFGLPVYTVAGASLMGTFVTSIAGVLFYSIIAPLYPYLSVSPDWLLGILFGVGGMAGMYLGARCQKRMSATLIKWILAAIISITAIRYFIEFYR